MALRQVSTSAHVPSDSHSFGVRSRHVSRMSCHTVNLVPNVPQEELGPCLLLQPIISRARNLLQCCCYSKSTQEGPALSSEYWWLGWGWPRSMRMRVLSVSSTRRWKHASCCSCGHTPTSGSCHHLPAHALILSAVVKPCTGVTAFW